MLGYSQSSPNVSFLLCLSLYRPVFTNTIFIDCQMQLIACNYLIGLLTNKIDLQINIQHLSDDAPNAMNHSLPIVLLFSWTSLLISQYLMC